MNKIFKKIERKIDGLIWTYVVVGIILILLAILVVFNDFMLRITCGVFILVLAYTFIYFGYKIWDFKKEIKEYLGIKK